MTFDEVLPLVKVVCGKWAHRYPALDFNEFVNEVWLRCDFSKFSRKDKRAGQYIEWRIVEYLRDTFGRTGRWGHKKHEGRNSTVRLSSLEFDPTCVFGDFDTVDSDDSFDWLISSLSPNPRFVIDHYYRHGLTLKKIGVRLDLGEARICQIRQDALRELQGRLSA